MQTEPQYLVERFGRALSYRSLEGRSLSVAIPTLALSICATVCVVLRVVTKWWILKTGIQTDDGFLVLCAVSITPLQGVLEVTHTIEASQHSFRLYYNIEYALAALVFCCQLMLISYSGVLGLRQARMAPT